MCYDLLKHTHFSQTKPVEVFGFFGRLHLLPSFMKIVGQVNVSEADGSTWFLLDF